MTASQAATLAPASIDVASPPGRRPRVTLGLPVFNGENYLAAAIDSILAQTFSDFELIISDNASTDRTAAICQAYAERDRRIKYVRNPQNLGAVPNFNRLVSLAQGEYFKWCAHDDVLRPRYLEACVAALEAAPDASLCHCAVTYIDEHGQELGTYDTALTGRDADGQATRFAALVLGNHPSLDLFGLMRRAALVRTQLHGNFHNGDRAVLAELALCGRMLQLSEPLILMRDHPGRYTRSVNRPRDRIAWHDTGRRRVQLPTWRLYREYLGMVRRHVAPGRERWRCYHTLARWWGHNWNWARLATDLVALAVPQALHAAEALKQRLFAPAPGAQELRNSPRRRAR